MQRLTKQSGAFMTMTTRGLVRGCRTCKTALSADMSCPKCGVRCASGKLATLSKAELELVREHTHTDHTCKACGYVEHAPTCRTLFDDEWRQLATHAGMEHVPSGKRIGYQDAHECGLLQHLKDKREQAARAQLQAIQGQAQAAAQYQPTYANQWIQQSTSTIANQAYVFSIGGAFTMSGSYASAGNTLLGAIGSSSTLAQQAHNAPIALDHKPSNFAEYIAQRTGSK